MMSEIFIAHSTLADGNMSFRFGTASAVVANREQFVLKHGIETYQYICMRCDHGSIITTVNRSNNAAHIGAKSQLDMIESEVLVTQERGLALMLLTADCLPVSFYDPVTGTIALAHMSRATIAANLPQQTITHLQQTCNVNPTNLYVSIGPCAKAASYHFSLPLNEVKPAIAPFITERGGRAHIDLVAAHNHQLTELGVPKENISFSPIDTITHPDYFSHYAETRLGHTTKHGRFATVLMLRP